MLMFICTELYSSMFSNLTIIKVLILLFSVEAYILMPWRMLGTRSSGKVWLYPDLLTLSLSCSRTHRIRFLSVQVTIIHVFFCVSDKKNLVDWYDQNWCYFSNLRQKKYSLKFSMQEKIKAATLAATIPVLSFFKTIALNRKLTTVVIFFSSRWYYPAEDYTLWTAVYHTNTYDDGNSAIAQKKENFISNG